MKVLLIGNRGFIGSHCQEYLLAEGKHVIGCDVLPALRSQDVCIEKAEDVVRLIRSYRFDLIINASGSPGVGFSLEYTEKDRELNYGNVKTWLDALVQHSPKTRFVNFSSAAVYGNPDQLPILEKDPLKPLSPYGIHKKMSEELLQSYHDQHGLQTISLRVFSAFGPRLRKQLFWDIYRKSRLSPSIELSGDGTESRDFIYIDDLVYGLKLVVDKARFEGQAINFASGIEITIREAATVFLGFLGDEYKVHFNGLQKTGDPRNWLADIRSLKALGFEPRVSIEAGLKNTLDDYLHQDLI